MKNLKFRSAFAIIALFLGLNQAKASMPNDEAQFAFGSCNSLRFPQSYFRQIKQFDPFAWIWLGDIVYGDDANAAEKRTMYSKIKNKPAYRSLIATTPVMGVWDDHDYCSNNFEGRCPEYAARKDALLDFLDVPLLDARRFRDGVYSKQIFKVSGYKVKFLIVDGRTFRTKETDINPTMLGESQMKWLKSELHKNDADLVFLGTGSIFLTDSTRGETWQDYPDDKKRVLNWASKSKVPVVILSGDVHFAEVMKKELETQSTLKPRTRRTMYEFVSSGLTHFREKKVSDNPARIDEPVYAKNFGLVKITGKKTDLQLTFEARDPDTGKLLKAWEIPLNW